MTRTLQRASKTPTGKSAQASYPSKDSTTSPAASPQNMLLRLQQAVGNRAMQGLLSPDFVQTKLTVSHPGDVYEREADRTADAVMRMADHQGGHSPARRSMEQVSRQGQEEKEWDTPGYLQRKPDGASSATVNPGLESQIASISGGGQPLPDEVRAFFEPRFGHDFSNVRVHTGGKAARAARQVNARAFTLGRDVVMGEGQYSPGSSEGKRLLAHELTHVVQQRSNAVQAKELLQRWSFGAGAAPHGDYIEVPDDERARVTRAMNIVGRIATNPQDFPRCRRFFRNNCPGGSNDTLKNVYDRAVMWKDTDATILGSQVDPDNIAYTNLSFRVGRWAMAATFIHELIHVCGQGDHGIGDDAKGVCGRLPNI